MEVPDSITLIDEGALLKASQSINPQIGRIQIQTADRVEVTEEEVQSLAQSILVRYGIDFTCYEPKSLRRRIIRLINNFELSSIHDLWVKFLSDRQFIQIFMNEVSVGMTSMFRDPMMWSYLKRLLQKEFPEKGNLNIWHAGCSTGEEVYSMGILLRESHLDRNVKAVASDINVDAMKIAQEGVYHKIKMIENETNFREYNRLKDFSSYYTTDSKNGIMDPALIQHVDFQYNNLITEPPPAPAQFDIIFCRNVMIYFNAPTKEKLLDKFFQSLKPGGLFIIGFYDTMLPIIREHSFQIEDEASKIFRK